MSGQTAHFFYNQTIFTIMKTKQIITTVLCAFLFGACVSKTETPEPSLPQFTRDGKNTLGCYVNGKMFIADYYHTGWGTGYSIEATLSPENELSIYSVDLDMNKSEIELNVIYKDSLGTYKLEDPIIGNTTSFVDFSFFGGKQFWVDKNNPGKLTITRITDEFVSGTFKFTGVSQEGDTVRITDGRFDVRFRQF
ncbi:MAG: hypothetical protein ACI83I_001894 [Bacteroidia bacterium]